MASVLAGQDFRLGTKCAAVIEREQYSRPGWGAALVAGRRPFDRRVIWVGGVMFAVLTGGNLEYVNVTITDLHYDTGAARRSGGPDEGASQRSE